MTAASIAYAPSDAIDPVDVFIARCAAQAKLYAAGEFDQQEAVDVLQAAAERDGLVKALGQDRVQQIMANAFRPVREALGDFDIVLDAPIEPPEPRNERVAESTVEALCYALRTDGIEALQRTSTQNSLAELSVTQLETVVVRMTRARGKYPKITDDLLLALGELLP